MSDITLRNAWTTVLPIDATRQKVGMFLEQNGMKILSTENDFYQAQQDSPILADEIGGHVNTPLEFSKHVTIQIHLENGKTHVDVMVEDISEGGDISPEVKEQHELFLKKWMWNLYNLLPADQPAPPPVPPQQNPQQVDPAVWTASPAPGYSPQATPGQPYYPPGYIRPKSAKDRGLALVLEIVPDLFGIYGIGWIYSGNSSTGVAWLIGGLVWDVIAIIIAAVTGGIALFCTIPVNILLTALSATSLNTYTKNHPEIFGV